MAYDSLNSKTDHVTAIRSEKNMEYVWDDVIDQMVGYLRSNNVMVRNASEYEEFGRNMIKKDPSLS